MNSNNGLITFVQSAGMTIEDVGVGNLLIPMTSDIDQIRQASWSAFAGFGGPSIVGKGYSYFVDKQNFKKTGLAGEDWLIDFGNHIGNGGEGRASTDGSNIVLETYDKDGNVENKTIIPSQSAETASTVLHSIINVGRTESESNGTDFNVDIE